MAQEQVVVKLQLDEKNSVEVNLHGATLTSWIQDGTEMIFVSKNAVFNNKKAIRGGIPVVFPQFGPWDLGPQHGFARISKWEQAGHVKVEDGRVTGVFCLTDTEETRAMWNGNRFELLYTVVLSSKELRMELAVTNKGDSPFSFTWLLHTYLKLNDINMTTISGLKGLSYTDKTKGGDIFVEQNEPVKVTDFTDRVYKDAHGPHEVTGVAGGKTVQVEKDNFKDTVLWNPWTENAKKMSDFGDDEYPFTVCVEAGCVAEPVQVAPGAQVKSSQILRVM